MDDSKKKPKPEGFRAGLGKMATPTDEAATNLVQPPIWARKADTTMTTNTNTKAAFTLNQIVRVWETKGVRDLKGGPSTSERIDGDYANVEPTEDLLVIRKLGSTKAIVRREDGSEISIHLNHINPTSSYYALRGQKKDEKASMKAQLAEKQAELAQAQLETEELDSARDEAEALFAEG